MVRLGERVQAVIAEPRAVVGDDAVEHVELLGVRGVGLFHEDGDGSRLLCLPERPHQPRRLLDVLRTESHEEVPAVRAIRVRIGLTSLGVFHGVFTLFLVHVDEPRSERLEPEIDGEINGITAGVPRQRLGEQVDRGEVLEQRRDVCRGRLRGETDEGIGFRHSRRRRRVEGIRSLRRDVPTVRRDVYPAE